MILFLPLQSAIQKIFKNIHQHKPAYFKVEIYFRNTLSKYLLLMLFFLFAGLFCSKQAMADYTVASGTTINATSLTSESGVLTINGRINISSNVLLPYITSVINNGSTGNIFWTNNSDFSFDYGTIFIVFNAGAGAGLQPTLGNGNGYQRLVIVLSILPREYIILPARILIKCRLKADKHF